MATRKKAAKGKPAPKKNTTKNVGAKRSGFSGKKAAKDTPPIRVIVEGVVVLRIEGSGLSASSIAGGLLGGGPDANFSYAFDLQGCKVTNFVVGHYITKDPVADSGTFYSPIYDPSTPPEIHVVVVAVQNFPVCTGTLTLKYLGKDVFTSPKQIVFSGAKGSINEIVKLPL